MGEKAKTRVRVDKASRRTRPYHYEFLLQIVRLYMEERYNTTVLCEQFVVSSHSVHRWAMAYRQQGVERFVSKRPHGAKPKLTKAVKNRILGVKRSHPEYGPPRVAAVLKRFFLMSAGATSVHKTLSDDGLTKKAKSKPVKNPTKPRLKDPGRINNGGNLNHMAVDEVLTNAVVVPINNQANTAPYNGAIENTQVEFKIYLRC